MPAKSDAERRIYQLKITLDGTDPPIWRRVAVPGQLRLDQLHDVLQVVMGWEDAHLHQFKVGRQCYGMPDPDFPDDMANEKKFRLDQLARKKKVRFLYEYDFGDSWEHELLVEEISAPEADKTYPVCLAGSRHCPPEDCGGVWGYTDFVEAVTDPKHPEHEAMLQWYGEPFDPAAFDLEAVNRALRRLRIP